MLGKPIRVRITEFKYIVSDDGRDIISFGKHRELSFGAIPLKTYFTDDIRITFILHLLYIRSETVEPFKYILAKRLGLSGCRVHNLGIQTETECAPFVLANDPVLQRRMRCAPLLFVIAKPLCEQVNK